MPGDWEEEASAEDTPGVPEHMEAEMVPEVRVVVVEPTVAGTFQKHTHM